MKMSFFLLVFLFCQITNYAQDTILIVDQTELLKKLGSLNEKNQLNKMIELDSIVELTMIFEKIYSDYTVNKERTPLENYFIEDSLHNLLIDIKYLEDLANDNQQKDSLTSQYLLKKDALDLILKYCKIHNRRIYFQTEESVYINCYEVDVTDDVFKLKGNNP